MANKYSNVEMDIVLEMVIEMLLKGLSRTDILRYFAEKEKKSERSVDYYLKKAKEEISKRFDADKEFLKKKALGRIEDLYKKNYTIQDYRECRQVIELQAKMFGLNDAEKRVLEIELNYDDMPTELLEEISKFKKKD